MFLRILSVLFTGALVLSACGALPKTTTTTPSVTLPMQPEVVENDSSADETALQFIEFYSPF